MTEPSATWTNTTHDWAVHVDGDHLATIRNNPHVYAPGGVAHLVLEVLAYANDEAEALGTQGKAVVTMHADGSVSVADDGRGTDTRRDTNGHVIKKPIMSTKDLRFFDPVHATLLPDGTHRRGISVVAALSEWLTHTNRRENGSWTQRYAYGLPASDLVPIDGGIETGTTVHFMADKGLSPAAESIADYRRHLAAFPRLDVVVFEA